MDSVSPQVHVERAGSQAVGFTVGRFAVFAAEVEDDAPATVPAPSGHAREVHDEGADASVGATMAAAFSPGPVVSVQNRFAAIAEDEAQAPSPEVHISVGGFSHGVMPTDGTGEQRTSRQTTQVGVGLLNTSGRAGSRRSSRECGSQDWRPTCGFRDSKSGPSAAMVIHERAFDMGGCRWGR